MESITGQSPSGIIAATFNDQLVREAGELIGEDAMWAGYAGFYGTGLNIHRTPYSGRVFEYYSEDPLLSGIMAEYVTEGVQSRRPYILSKIYSFRIISNIRPALCRIISSESFPSS